MRSDRSFFLLLLSSSSCLAWFGLFGACNVILNMNSTIHMGRFIDFYVFISSLAFMNHLLNL